MYVSSTIYLIRRSDGTLTHSILDFGKANVLVPHLHMRMNRLRCIEPERT